MRRGRRDGRRPEGWTPAGGTPSLPTAGARGGASHAALPDQVQLHPGDLGAAHRNPEDRRKAAQSYIESVGGTLHGFWYAFGSHDGVNLWEAPDDVSMAAVALAVGSGGALSTIETTVLLSVEDTMAALRTAQGIGYRAPGA